MIPPVGSVACLTPVTCLGGIPGLGGLTGGLTRSVTNAAAGAVLDVVNSSMSGAADWLVGHVMGLIGATATPRFDKAWFVQEAHLMGRVVAVVLLPILMAASIGPVLRQDGRRLFRVWGVGLPVAVLAGAAATQTAGLAVSAVDALCRILAGSHPDQLGGRFHDAVTSGAWSKAPIFVQMLLSVLIVAGTLLVWLEMMVRSAAVYVATFFMPLVLVGYIWPATAVMAKRAVEILVSLIMSKFVIVASLTLGVAALVGSGPDTAITGAGILLLAGFAPFALMRLAPVVEAAAIAHLEGMSRRPLRAATRTVSSAAAAPVHPVTQLMMSTLRRSSGGTAPAARPVAAQVIPERQADYPTSPPQAGRHG